MNCEDNLNNIELIFKDSNQIQELIKQYSIMADKFNKIFEDALIIPYEKLHQPMTI